MFMTALDQVSLLWKLRQTRSKFYEPHVKIKIDTPKFLIKTADQLKELKEVFKLRSKVFFKEILNKKFYSPIDIDSYDLDSDHLIIIEKKTNRIVGTYRLRSSLFTKKFYAQSEFQLDPLLDLPGVKLELGRACIAKEFRKGTVIHLIWRGIAEYLEQTKSNYLFGCTSVHVTPEEYQKLYFKFIKENTLHPSLKIQPLPAFQPDFYGYHHPAHDFSYNEKIEIPPLLSFYLKAGSKIIVSPAYDPEFHCIDFLTLLDLNELTTALSRKYKK